MESSSLDFVLINGLDSKELGESTHFVYAHKCPAGVYIGLSVDPVKRWEEHVSDARNEGSPQHAYLFHSAIRKHLGEFSHFLIAVAGSEYQGRQLEAAAIEFYGSTLNMREEVCYSTEGYEFQPLSADDSQVVTMRKKGRPGAWVSRTDSDRVPVVAEVFYDSRRRRKRLRSIEGQPFPADLKVECSRNRNHLDIGDRVRLYVALSVRHGRPYLVAPKTDDLIPL